MDVRDIYGAGGRDLSRTGLPWKLGIAHVVSSLKAGDAEQVVVDLAALQRAAGHDVTVIAIADDPDGPRAEQLRRRGVDVQLLPKRRGFDVSVTARLVALFRAKGSRSSMRTTSSRSSMPRPRAGCTASRSSTRSTASRTTCKAGDGCAAPPPRSSTPTSRSRGRRPRCLSTRARSARRSCTSSPAASTCRGSRPIRWPGPASGPSSAISQQAWVLGSVARLSAVKNHALLLRAAAQALPEDGRLLLVGDGPERARLVALARELGLSDRALFVGGRHGVPQILAALDAFALCSIAEGLPLAVLEAMAAGLPVVATAVGGVPTALTHGYTGFLVPSGDAEALAARLTALRDNPALAAQMGRYGRKVTLQRYSAARMVERYMDLYALLLVRQLHRGVPAVRPSDLLAYARSSSFLQRAFGVSTAAEVPGRGWAAPRSDAAASARRRSPIALSI